MSREIHIHVEEQSMEAFLVEFLPRVLAPEIARRIINHGSKQKLLIQLPHRLNGYAKIPADYRPKVLVLVDRDQDDCHALKARLEAAVVDAGLRHKAQGGNGAFDVVNRVVVEELEAWYFGDMPAVAAAWPGVSPNLANRRGYRDPDAIAGGTHEAFFRVLQKAGHLKGQVRLPKIEVARTIAPHIDPQRNRSQSFGHFLSGLMTLDAIA